MSEGGGGGRIQASETQGPGGATLDICEYVQIRVHCGIDQKKHVSKPERERGRGGEGRGGEGSGVERRGGEGRRDARIQYRHLILKHLEIIIRTKVSEVFARSLVLFQIRATSHETLQIRAKLFGKCREPS